MRQVGERPLLVVLLTTAALLALLLSRVVSEAGRELAAADAARNDGRVGSAIEHYRRALRWSYPLSAKKREAVAALEAIAGELEAANDREAALLAWRSLSGGLAASRSLYVARDPSRDEANEEIARLLAADRIAGIDAGSSEAQVAADHRRLLSEDLSPDPFWGSLLLLGMAAWVGALLILARRGFDSTGRLQRPLPRAPLLGVVIGFLSFTLGLLFA